mgnify:CR=1 FL=1
MSNGMLSVWRDGEWWYDFPEQNYNNVIDLLQKRGLTAKCLILPKGESPKPVRVKVLNQETIITNDVPKKPAKKKNA